MTKLLVWTDPDRCSGCKHCCMDMSMDPYCAHPTVKAKHPYGLNLNPAIKEFCGKEGKLEELTLWEAREPRAGVSTEDGIPARP